MTYAAVRKSHWNTTKRHLLSVAGRKGTLVWLFVCSCATKSVLPAQPIEPFHFVFFSFSLCQSAIVNSVQISTFRQCHRSEDHFFLVAAPSKVRDGLQCLAVRHCKSLTFPCCSRSGTLLAHCVRCASCRRHIEGSHQPLPATINLLSPDIPSLLHCLRHRTF